MRAFRTGMLLIALMFALASPVRAESANGTHVYQPTDPPLVGANGSRWGISAAGKVTVDGVEDATTGSVMHLHYQDHTVSQRNVWGHWYSKQLPTDAWAAASAPSGLPRESDEDSRITRATDPALVSVDLASWTLGTDGRIYVNGAVDPGTANVVLIQYSHGRLYHRNAAWVWYSRHGLADTWHLSQDPNIGPVGPGQWAALSLNGIVYFYLPPAGSHIGIRYPVVLFLHQASRAIATPAILEPWFNSTAFRSRYQVITVAPRCLSMDTARINWGGLTAGATDCEVKALAIVRDVVARYGDAKRVYVVGTGDGGAGAWDMMVRYAALNGRDDRVFAAGLSLSGSVATWGSPPAADVVAQFASGVPMAAIHGAADAQMPLDWDRAMAKALAGKATFLYQEKAGYGANVWDAFLPMPQAQPTWDWLFRWQSTLSQPPIPSKPSVDGTTIKPGSSGAIVDSTNAVWGIDANRRVTRNGSIYYSMAVAKLVWSGGLIWRQAPYGVWWRIAPSLVGGWQPLSGTRTGPATGG